MPAATALDLARLAAQCWLHKPQAASSVRKWLTKGKGARRASLGVDQGRGHTRVPDSTGRGSGVQGGKAGSVPLHPGAWVSQERRWRELGDGQMGALELGVARRACERLVWGQR